MHVCSTAVVVLRRQLAQEGVINVPARTLGLCSGVTGAAAGARIAPFRTTTEVYPDSPSATDAVCSLAQVAAISGALDFLVHKGCA